MTNGTASTAPPHRVQNTFGFLGVSLPARFSRDGRAVTKWARDAA
ncbi:hypothetical protein MINT15_24070 [Saccharomonospora viridis]|uniref:Uncharacterized protein n=1 Tax=Saccharomonospora viridis TaxID=1852 RepID=A0A837D8C9_9PSEU|nr:hypothetical protein MINT15_24070 [Saccharomonospora viridis]